MRGMHSLAAFRGAVEFIPVSRPGQIRHVLFDFDGTLSLIREGWAEVIVDVSRNPAAAGGETEEARRQVCREDIMRSTASRRSTR